MGSYSINYYKCDVCDVVYTERNKIQLVSLGVSFYDAHISKLNKESLVLCYECMDKIIGPLLVDLKLINPHWEKPNDTY